MKRYGCFFPALIMFFIFSACTDGSTGTTAPPKRFDAKLQGLWISEDPSIYDGVVDIDYSIIEISGYVSNMFYEFNHGEENRPFKNYKKNLPLTGYSEWLAKSKTRGEIFIEINYETQYGIPYEYSEFYNPKTYQYEAFLLLKFGNRWEELRKVPDNYFDPVVDPENDPENGGDE